MAGLRFLMVCPMACIKCVLPMPTPPYRNSGLYALDGCSATAREAACANSLDLPTTKVSNVYRRFSWWSLLSKSNFDCFAGFTAGVGAAGSSSVQTYCTRTFGVPISWNTALTISPYVRVSTCRNTVLGIWTNSVSPSARFRRVGWNQVAKVLTLTLDFTRSRNLSQELTGSRSRARFVAVVITRKNRTLGYFHRCA